MKIAIKEILKLLLFSISFYGYGQNNYILEYLDIKGLPTSEIYDIFEDSKGIIWISTGKGTFAYDNGNLLTFDAENGLTDNSTIRTFETPWGDTWIVTETGSINKINNMVVEHDEFLNSLSSTDLKSFYNITFGKDNIFLNSHHCDEYVLNIAGKTIKPFSIVNDTSQFNLFLTTFEGKKVIHFNDKRYGLDVKTTSKEGKGGTSLLVGSSFTESKNFSILTEIGDSAFVSIGSKILLFKGLSLVLEYDLKNKSEILSMIVDDERNLWVSSFGDGIYRFNNCDLKRSPTHHFDNNTFSKLIKPQHGSIIASTLNSGLVRLKKVEIAKSQQNSRIRFINKNGSSMEIAMDDVLQIFNGNAKPSTYKFRNGYVIGSLKLNNGSRLIYGNNMVLLKGKDTILISNRIVNVVEKGKKHVIFNQPHANLGVANFDMSRITKISNFVENKVNSIKHIGDDIFLLGTNNGLYEFDALNMKLKKLNNIRTTSLDYFEGTIYMGTDKNGVYSLSNGKTTKNDFGLQSTKVSQVKRIGKNLYVATDKGFVCCDVENEKINLNYVLTTNDLLNSNEINCFDFDKDSIYIGTNNGLAAISINFSKQRPNYKMEFTQISGFGIIDSLSRKYKAFNNSVEVRFRIIGLNFVLNPNYYYRVIGIDSTWIITQTNHIELYDLPPGNYILEVKSSVDGFESPKISYAFAVDSPIYWKGWVIISAIFILSLIAFVVIKLLRDKANINNRVLINELNVIRYQMNPHFIANTLNSLQGIILNDDFIKTNEYLSSFSNLVLRSINYSNNLFISLLDEMEYLRSYMSLMRLMHDHSIIIIESLPEDFDSMSTNLLVPPFFIQPIIENAIIHGVSKNIGEKIIRIGINVSNGILEIAIHDNGPGYKLDGEKSNRKFESYGFKNIDQRILIYKELKKHSISYEISKNELDGTGTKVAFKFKSLKKINI